MCGGVIHYTHYFYKNIDNKYLPLFYSIYSFRIYCLTEKALKLLFWKWRNKIAMN